MNFFAFKIFLFVTFFFINGCDSISQSGSSSKKGSDARAITIGFFPDQENFGIVRYSKSSLPRPVILKNLSKEYYFLNTISIEDEAQFRIDSHNCPGSTTPFAPDQSCEIDLVFTPSTYGPRSSFITAKFGTSMGSDALEAKGELIGFGGSSLLFPGIDDIVDIGGNEATLKWTHVVGATQYKIYRIENEKEIEIGKVNAPTKTFTAEKLSLNTEYSFLVRLLDKYGYPDDNKKIVKIKTLPKSRPKISSLSLNGGNSAGGTNIVISGENFQSNLKVYVGSTLCTSYSFVSETSATCKTPEGSVGAAEVKIINPDKQFGVYIPYTYRPAPTISSVSPSYGAWQGSTSITISGTGFIENPSVMIGSQACNNIEFVSATTIRCVTPGNGSMTGRKTNTVKVINTDTQEVSKTKGFTYEFSEAAIVAGSIRPWGCLGGSFSIARLWNIFGLFLDGSDLYYPSYGNGAVWKLDLIGEQMTRFAGFPCARQLVNGSESEARFYYANDIVKVGNDYFVSEFDIHQIRKIDGVTGAVTTVAGNGVATFADGVGAAARFNYPRGLATDGTYVYIADVYNHRIRRLDPITNTVTTIAGSGTAGAANGIGVAAQLNVPYDLTYYAGSLYVADRNNHRIRRIDLSTNSVTYFSGSGAGGQIDGAAGSAAFNVPQTISNNGTDLFVGQDLANVRRVSLVDGSVTTLAGQYNSFDVVNSTNPLDARFMQIYAIESDQNFVYVGDNFHTIRKINLASGEVSTLVGGTVSPRYESYLDGTTSRMNYPNDFAINGREIYFVDRGFHRVRKYHMDTGVVSTIAGSGGAGGADGIGAAATFYSPIGIEYCSGYLYVTDFSGHVLRRIDVATNTVTTIAGLYNTPAFANGTGTAIRFNYPTDVDADDSCSNLYISDYYNHRIRVFNIATQTISTLVGSGVGSTIDGIGVSAGLNSPYFMQKLGNKLYFTSDGDHRLRYVDLTNSQVTSVNSNWCGYNNSVDIASGFFCNPDGLTTDGSLIYIADGSNRAIRVYDPSTGELDSISANQSPNNLWNSGYESFGEIEGVPRGGAYFAEPRSIIYSPGDGLFMGSSHGIWRLR